MSSALTGSSRAAGLATVSNFAADASVDKGAAWSGRPLRYSLPADLPPGPGTVRAGMYTADGRLPVSRNEAPAGGYAVVGTFEVR